MSNYRKLRRIMWKREVKRNGLNAEQAADLWKTKYCCIKPSQEEVEE